MVAADGDALALYQLAYALFLPGFQRQLLADGIDPLPIGLSSEMERRLRHENASGSILQQLSGFEQRLFLGERLLRDTDAASMASSIETRLPLVDARLSERVARLDVQRRYQPLGRKQALRDAGLVGLDPQLFERPKSGFVIPFDRWIRAGLGKSMDELMNNADTARRAGLKPQAVQRLWDAYRTGRSGMYWSRVWAIYMLLRYCQRHGLSV
jgi:asparagine synthase (glutamine-hydrolysing)